MAGRFAAFVLFGLLVGAIGPSVAAHPKPNPTPPSHSHSHSHSHSPSPSHTSLPLPPDSALLPTDEWQGGLLIHTQGAGLGIAKSRYTDATHLRTWGADLLYMRNAKEEKTSNPVYDDGRSYVYGKVNALLMLRLTAGKTHVRTPKLRRDAVRLSTTWRVGGVLGLLKPVYLEIGYPDIPYDYIAVERYNPEVHFSDDIYGQAPWLNGIGELQPVPGLHASYAFDFEYGPERDRLKALTVGAAVDAFFWQPEILAERYNQNQRAFVTLFARMEVGRRWTR